MNNTKYFLLFYIISLVALTSLSAVNAAKGPTQPCTGCTTPIAGVYTDPYTNLPICTNCFNNKYGEPIWNNRLEKWVPTSGGGGGGGSLECMNSCHM